MKSMLAHVSSALCVVGLSLGIAAAQAATSEEAIIERIKPVGQVCLQGDDSCGSAAAAAAGGGARSAEDIVNVSCNACHMSGVLGAPKIGDAADWGARLSEKGLDMLVSNAINGINSMPARGTCADCSDDEIRISVEYMLEASQ